MGVSGKWLKSLVTHSKKPQIADHVSNNKKIKNKKFCFLFTCFFWIVSHVFHYFFLGVCLFCRKKWMTRPRRSGGYGGAHRKGMDLHQREATWRHQSRPIPMMLSVQLWLLWSVLYPKISGWSGKNGQQFGSKRPFEDCW